MAVFPQKPRTGQKVLQGLYNSVCQIIDYLPSLEVKGDNSSTSVTKTSNGTIIHTNNNNSSLNQSKRYFGFHGIDIGYDKYIICTLTGGTNITVNYWEQGHQGEDDYLLDYPTINCTLSAGRYIQITPEGVINYTGPSGGAGGATSGIGYPDYINLYANTSSTVSGIGISWLLPVSAGQTIRFYTDAASGTAHGRFAPQVGETGTAFYMQNDVTYPTNCNGWVRISVFDNGLDEGSCLRFYVNGVDGLSALPLYRFHGFTQYTAGAGIAIESGTIRNMIQTDHTELPNGSGIVSTGLYDEREHYNRVLTGIAIGLTSSWASDLFEINKHTSIGNKNKVLSCDNSGNIGWQTNVEPGGGTTVIFKAPDYAKLGVSPDAGETTLGLGTTYLVPVSNGSTVRYSADGGTIIARWAPVEGSTQNAFEVTTTNKTTTDDGYVRISVIDDGTLSAGCLRLYVNNKALPLHKFAKFNYSSGAIYEGGRYTTIQTTSTRINAETELEEEYQLENPIINNMLTGGRFITIQETENNVELEYPRINCDLSEGNNIEITTGGVINCTLTGTSQLTNNSNYITLADIPTYIGTSGIAISTILDENQQPTTSSNIYISASFYSTLTNPTSNRVLSCHNGSLTWAENTGGSGGGGGAGIYNQVLVKQQQVITAAPNTRYNLITFNDLSANQDYIDNGTFDNGKDSNGDWDITKFVAKWFIWEGESDSSRTVISTLYDHTKYDDYNSSYGGWRGSTWQTYNTSQIANVLLYLPSGTTDTSVEVIPNFGGQFWFTGLDCEVVDEFGDVLTGIFYSTPYYVVFSYDAATNRWYKSRY